MDIWNTPPPLLKLLPGFMMDFPLYLFYPLAQHHPDLRSHRNTLVNICHWSSTRPMRRIDRLPNTHAALGGGGGKELLTDPQR